MYGLGIEQGTGHYMNQSMVAQFTEHRYELKWKYIYKCHLHNGGHFVSASLC